MEDPGESRDALIDEVRALRDEVRRLNDQRYFRIESSVAQVALWSLLRGLAWGLGSVLGATILLSILLRMLGLIDFIPVVGDWAQQTINEIQQAHPGLPPK